MPSSSERRKEIYQERKAKGLCTACGKAPAREGIVLCETCEERRISLRRKRYKENPEPERAKQHQYYLAHQEELQIKSMKYYSKNKELIKQAHSERYNWLKEHHICVQCGSQQAVENMVRCADCLEKQYLSERKRDKKLYAYRYRLDKINRGECARCKKPAVKGMTLCEYHRSQAKISNAKYYNYNRKYSDQELHDLRSKLGKGNILIALASEKTQKQRDEFRKQSSAIFLK